MRFSYHNLLLLGLAAFSALQSSPAAARALDRRGEDFQVARSLPIDLSARAVGIKPKPKAPKDKTPDTPATDNNGKPIAPTTGDSTTPVDSDGNIVRIGTPQNPDKGTPSQPGNKPEDKPESKPGDKPEDKPEDKSNGSPVAQTEKVEDFDAKTPGLCVKGPSRLFRRMDRTCYSYEEYQGYGRSAQRTYDTLRAGPPRDSTLTGDYLMDRPSSSTFGPDFYQQLGRYGDPDAPPRPSAFEEAMAGDLGMGEALSMRNIRNSGPDGKMLYTGRGSADDGFLFTETTYADVDRVPKGDPGRRYASDLAYEAWSDIAGPSRSSLRAHYQKDISNEGTSSVINRLYEDKWPDRTEHHMRPILRVNSGRLTDDLDEISRFDALSGTENVKPTYRMIGDHYEDLGKPYVSHIDIYPPSRELELNEKPRYSMGIFLDRD